MRADRSRAEPQYSAGKEYCILCGRLTETAKGKPLSEREHYIEGAGQLCRECYQGLYVPRHNGNVVQIAGTLSQFWEKHSKLRKMGYKDGRDKT